MVLKVFGFLRKKEKDKAELSQSMILIAGFGTAAVVAIGGVASVSLVKGEDAANCINNANTFKSGSVDKGTCATSGGSDSGGTLTPGDNDNVTPGEPIGGKDEDSSEVPEEEESLLDYTPDECFEFDSGTIKNYLIKEKPILCLEDVIIPDKIDGQTVTDIGYGAFDKKGITSVVIPDSVRNFAHYAFRGNKLTEVVLPSSLKKVNGADVFKDNNLTSVTFSSDITEISSGAFSGNNLTKIEIPNSVSKIGSAAFFDNQLESVKIPDKVTVLEQSVFFRNNISEIHLPNGLEEMGVSALSTNKLTNVEIPDSVVLIKRTALKNNLLTNIEISSSTVVEEDSVNPGVTITRR